MLLNAIPKPGHNRINGLVLLSAGFRPFYLCAGYFAGFAILLWIAQYLGLIQYQGYLQGVTWHSHEMLFGFSSAVIAGFLLTAVPAWTQRPTPKGSGLLLMAGIWLLARVLMITGPANLAVAVDTVFLPILIAVLAVPIWRSRNSRNYKVLMVLTVLTGANIVFHLVALGVVSARYSGLPITLTLDAITLLMAIVGGRVIPVFTNNAIAGANAQRYMAVESIALGALVLVVGLDLLRFWFPGMEPFWLAALVMAGLSHGLRLFLWNPLATWRDPLLFMLPMAYFWIPTSLLLRASTEMMSMSAAAATHAITLGAMSSLMLAMIMRSSLGHTGRPLRAGKFEVAVFVFMQVAAVTRVVASLVPGKYYTAVVVVSGLMAALAFLVFIFRYTIILIKPRIDEVS